MYSSGNRILKKSRNKLGHTDEVRENSFFSQKLIDLISFNMILSCLVISCHLENKSPVLSLHLLRVPIKLKHFSNMNFFGIVYLCFNCNIKINYYLILTNWMNNIILSAYCNTIGYYHWIKILASQYCWPNSLPLQLSQQRTANTLKIK